MPALMMRSGALSPTYAGTEVMRSMTANAHASPRMLTIRAALPALFVVAASLRLEAQPRLVISGREPAATGSLSLTAAIDLRTVAVEWVEPTAWNQPLITSDGRYLVAAPAPGRTPSSGSPNIVSLALSRQVSA